MDESATFFPRLAAKRLKDALADTPVVIVHGPRQCGKTTLARRTAARHEYLTFDDTNLLAAAQSDPVGFVQRLGSSVILDEVQKVPELFPEIKKAVDENRKPGRFLLTGSTDLNLLPQLSESLAGRMEVVRLHPLAECEIEKRGPQFLETLLEGDIPAVPDAAVDDLNARVLRGGFPEAVRRRIGARRRAWHEQYLDAVLLRDAPEISGIRHADQLPRLFSRLAAQSGQLLNVTDAANGLKIERQTADAYINVLERQFLVERLQPWSANRINRLVKTPKIHVLDSGLTCMANDLAVEDIQTDPKQFGLALETFVFNELRRQASGLSKPVQFGYFRNKDKHEIDIIMQAKGKRLLGVEVKSSQTVREADFRGMKAFQTTAKTRLLAGIVLYRGTHTLRFGEGFFALPLRSLWTT